MDTKEGEVVIGDAVGADWSVSEDFSHYDVGTKMEVNMRYPTPSGMGFKVGNQAGPDYPADAHITSEGSQHALAVQLGSLDRNTPSNLITIDFQSAITHSITKVGVTINSAFAGVPLTLSGAVFVPPDFSQPPGEMARHFLSVKGEATYFFDTPIPIPHNIPSVSIKVGASPSNPGTELPVKIKRVSWVQSERSSLETQK